MNAWLKNLLDFSTCAEDEVFMPNEAWLDEYVLNDHGILYQGSANSISASRWYFGQVRNDVLRMLQLTSNQRAQNAFMIIFSMRPRMPCYKKQGFGLRIIFNSTMHAAIGRIVLASCQFIGKSNSIEFCLSYLFNSSKPALQIENMIWRNQDCMSLRIGAYYPVFQQYIGFK